MEIVYEKYIPFIAFLMLALSKRNASADETKSMEELSKEIANPLAQIVTHMDASGRLGIPGVRVRRDVNVPGNLLSSRSLRKLRRYLKNIATILYGRK